ncbi:MAG: hypothetical protein RLY20_2264 [Verrucomicrobiota bacterium]
MKEPKLKTKIDLTERTLKKRQRNMNSNLFSAQPNAAAGPKDQGRARVKIAVFSVLAVHVAGLTALLLTQGCRREEAPPPVAPETPAVTNTPAITDTNLPSAMTTNFPSFGEAISNTVPPVVQETPIASPTKYKIKKGDNFSTIGTQFHVTAAAIVAANPGVDPKKLQINQEINIPAPTAPKTPTAAVVDAGGPTTYKVVSGDTLGSIAKKFGTTVKAIQSLNGLTTTSIKAGQTLKIPVKAAPAPAPEMPAVAPIAPATTTPPAQ